MKRAYIFLLAASICIALFVCYGQTKFVQTPHEPVARPVYVPVSSSVAIRMQFIAAGIPEHEYKNILWSTVFAKLASSNMSIFLPTFQFQEVPEAKSSGYEVDFLTPCTAPQLVHTAMQGENVKLLIPLEVWYPASEPLPSLAVDPLSQFIACVGREQIAGVTLYDEAVHVGVPLQKVKELYERVKEVDATLPIFGVHAFVTADADGVMTEAQRQAYFEDVVTYSAYADIVGFDVYAIPASLAKISSPYAAGAQLPYDRAIEDYMLWLADRIPNKQHIMVFQAFSFADQYSNDILATLPKELVDTASIAPTQAEIETMVSLAQKYHVSYVAWWGQSLLKKNLGVWESILKTTKTLKK